MRSFSGNGPISTPEMIVGAGLRYLCGELHKSIADMYYIGVRTAIAIVDKFLYAVEDNSALEQELNLKSQLMIGTNCRVLLESIYVVVGGVFQS